MNRSMYLFKIGRGQFGLLRAFAVLLFYFMLGQPLPAFSLVNDKAADPPIASKEDEWSKAPKLRDLKADDSEAFITVWEVPADDLTIRIPINTGFSGYNYSISWEKEGSSSVIVSLTGQRGAKDITVPAAGRYIVKIRGEFPHFNFQDNNQKDKDRNKLVAVQQWGTINWKSFAGAFYRATNLKSVPKTSPDLTSVTNMSFMFYEAKAFDGDLSDWNVSKVDNMSYMFVRAKAFNGNLSNWNVSQVRSMHSMFYEASTFNGDLSHWNTSEVRIMNSVFYGASVFNGDLSSWNVLNVNDMSYMFSGAKAFNKDVNSWIVSNVKNMSYMFRGASAFNGELSSWDVSNVNDMSYMFSGASVFNRDISRWDVSKVNKIYFMFTDAKAFEGDLSKWAVSNVTSMQAVFYGAEAFNSDLSSWNFSTVTNMRTMFTGATAFNRDLSSWDISKVTDMSSMLSNSGLSRLNYDKTLTGWADSKKSLMRQVQLGALGLKWCNANAKRTFLIKDKGWIITGDKQDCSDDDDRDAFITIWEVKADDLTIRIPISKNWKYKYDITLEVDGTPNSRLSLSDQTKAFSHTVSRVGRYVIKIRGDFPHFDFKDMDQKDRDKLIAVQHWGDIKWKSFAAAFYKAAKLLSFPSIPPDLGEVTDMSEMFYEASIFRGYLSSWNVSKVTNMSKMFYGAKAFNGDISKWDVSKVVDMSSMFNGASTFNTDISKWDVSKVTNMLQMFSRAFAFKGDLRKWDVSQVGNMSSMFSAALAFNGDLSRWNVSKVKDMEGMFWGVSTFNSDLASWDVSQVTNMSYMFYEASAFNGNLREWDVAEVKNMSSMFNGARSFNQDLSRWDVSQVGDMSQMFRRASAFKGDLRRWDVSQVGNMFAMFMGASAFNSDLSSWDVSQVGNMSGMFSGASAFNRDLSRWNVSKVTNMWQMFSGASAFNGDLASWDVSQVGNMSEMFSGAKAFKGDLSRWNVSKVKDMSKMFDGASAFKADISRWNVSNVTNMSEMFRNAFAFNVNLASWDISQVNSMDNMLSGSGLSSSNYDKTLKGWAVNLDDLKRDVSLGANGLYWCDSQIARHLLINVKGWKITGDKENCAEDMAGDAFITVWEVKADDLHIKIPISSAWRYKYHVVWKKSGTQDSEQHVFDQTGALNIDVTEPGRYVVKISGEFPHFNLGNSNQNERDKLVAVQQWGGIKWKSFNAAFKGARNLESVPSTSPDLSEVTDMSEMFRGASSFKGDLSSWNVSKVENMTAVFEEASAFNSDLSSWNVANVKYMSSMFYKVSAFNSNLASWNVAKVENMFAMFRGATAFNQDLSKWDVSLVKNMQNMLSNSGLSASNYDKTLKGWANNRNGLVQGIVLGADGLNWCTAAAARAILINQNSWTITGDKQDCIQPDANNILYVSESATGEGNGRSWADALPELADALKWARTQADAGLGWQDTKPLKIYVAVGTYRPLYSAEDGKHTEDGQRKNSFVLVKNVQLYAGFDPKNDHDFHKRVQPKAGLLLENPQGTILSADLAKNDQVTEQNGVLDFINYADNAYHVLIAAGDLGEALLDGFVVQGGNAEDLGTMQVNSHKVSNNYGAGLSITKANPLLKNLEIAYNKGDYGGGMYFNYSDANLFNISVNHNHAVYGGGMNFDYSAANLFNISVNYNHAEYGGGINHFISNPSLSNMTITNNRASIEGAGLRNVDHSSPLVLNSILFGNTDANSLANNVFNDYSSKPTFRHSLLAGDGLWDAAWGKDGSTANGRNIVTNIDPFVDRAQGDFRLKRSSSAVDAGSMSRLWAALKKMDRLNYPGPMPAVTDVRWGRDLAGAARILDEQVDMGAYEFFCATEVPTADAQQSFCVDNVPTIARLKAKGNAIKWYSAAVEGTLYSATEVLVDGQTYYASQTKDGCESESRVAVKVKLIPLPDAPEVDAIQQLSYGDAPLTLSATASMDCELRWYSAETGGTPSLQAPVAETNVIGEQFFWVSQVIIGRGCEGPRAKITVKINKAMPKLGTLASLQKTYGDAPFTLSPPSSNSPGAFSYSSSATDVATVKDMEVTIIGAGTTRITVTQAATDYYNEATRTFDLLVDKAAISGVIFEDASYTYDGTAKLVELTGLPSDLTVSYSNNSHSDAGTYTATASINGGTNYVDQSLTAVLRIDKAVISSVIFEDASYTYDGTAKLVELTGLPSGATVSYSNNSQINAGTYTATASITGRNYVDQSLAAVLRIEKAVISAVIFEDASYTYDGTAKLVELTGLPSGATVSYSNNSQINAGTYTATANINGGTNYVDQSLTAVLRIEKAVISAVIFADASYTYDGTAKSVELSTALPTDVTVSYSNNSHSEAGTYTATASINGGTNYFDQSLTAVLRIEKATIGGVIFEDASYTYDGLAKSVELTTALPSGATVSYSNNRQIDVGTYNVTANITGGNYVDQSLTAVLTIEKAVISNIIFADASYTYDGTSKSVVLSPALPSGVTVSYSNNSQIDAGMYDVTANITGGRNYFDQSLAAVLRIAQKQQLISFETLAPVAKDAGLIRLDISSNSSLPIQLYSENTAVATVVGDGLQIVGVGTTVIRAEQAGDANHLAAAPVTQLLEVTAVKDPIAGIRVHQALSPNGDGINDFLRIDGIEKYPENKLLIFDSNSKMIQTIEGYNNHSNYFDGTKASKLIAKGTYFYILRVKRDGKWHTEKGFFVLR